MSYMQRQKNYYVITKHGMEHWYLYSVEQLSFGKKILWTSDSNAALIFSSEQAVETFKSKNLPKVTVDIHRFLKSTFSFTE